MKRFIALTTVIILLFSCACQAKKAVPKENTLQGVWVSYSEIPSTVGVSKSEYIKKSDEIFLNISKMGLNTAFVHIRAFSDAFYPSEIFPSSSYIAGTQGARLDYDPIVIMIESAEKYGIDFHAWLNPFRVATHTDIQKLSPDNPARKMLDSGNTDNAVCVLENGIYYNPACPAVHSLIIDGVLEFLEKHKVDGVHIDDYFYPSADEKIDSSEYKNYCDGGGKISLSQWRKNSVNAFVCALYSAVKNFDSNLIFSISPSGNIAHNAENLYADVETWLAEDCYADLIIPQLYYGFRHSYLPFEKTATEWALLKGEKVKLAAGIAAYKTGKEDTFAGDGINEWIDEKDVIQRQIESILSNPNYSGYVLFSYEYIFSMFTKNLQKNDEM